MPLVKQDADKISMLSTDEDETASGLVVDDSEDEDELRLSLAGRNCIDVGAEDRCARYLDG